MGQSNINEIMGDPFNMRVSCFFMEVGEVSKKSVRGLRYKAEVTIFLFEFSTLVLSEVPSVQVVSA